MPLQLATSGVNCVADGHAVLQDHYPAVDTDRVMMVMNNMVHAGRLQRVPHHHPTLVRMGGAIMQEAEAEQAAIWSDDADILAQERDHGNLISVKVCTDVITVWLHVYFVRRSTAHACQHCTL